MNQIVLAETQTSGRGRREKQWVSPHARSLSISVGMRTERNLADLGGLSSVVGVALISTLIELGVKDACLKWPNDVLVGNEKLCGILVELIKCDKGVIVVIGFGINVSLNQQEIESVAQPVTDLVKNGVHTNRTQLSILFLNSLIEQVGLFESRGFAPFISTFNELHALDGKQCNILIGSKEVPGIVHGVRADGALLLKTSEGIEAFHGGEVSLRPR